jgi:predicted peroxiredoxin
MVNCTSYGVATVEVNRAECEVAFYALMSGIVVFRKSAVEKLSSEKLKSLFICWK